jgi:arsenate reductase-like glutaredoxin family protein
LCPLDFRCLIRLSISRLDPPGVDEREVLDSLYNHLKVSLEICHSLLASTECPDISKDLAWLQKTVFNICVRYNDQWTPDQLVRFYNLAADMMEMSSLSGSNPASKNNEATSRMLLCRFIALSAEAQMARVLDSKESQVRQISLTVPENTDAEIMEQLAQFKSTLPQIELFRSRIDSIRLQGHRIDRMEDIYNSLYTLEVEALAGTGSWTQISNLVSAQLYPPSSTQTDQF